MHGLRVVCDAQTNQDAEVCQPGTFFAVPELCCAVYTGALQVLEQSLALVKKRWKQVCW